MLLLISALTLGLIFSLLALGVYISFKVFHFPDITADGSFTFGAAVTTALLVTDWHAVVLNTIGHSYLETHVPSFAAIAPNLAKLASATLGNPYMATLFGFLAGMLAGATTGLLHTRFKIHGLLSGILVMTALYSINLRVMGRSNVSLSNSSTLITQWTGFAKGLSGDATRVDLFGWSVGLQDIAVLIAFLSLVILVCILLFVFLQTNLGAAMRGAGDNSQMVRALGVSDNALLILGLALANGLVALSGSLLAQYQEFADVQMGIGMVVWGLASVIIGESLSGSGRYGLLIAGAVLGSVLFRLMIAIALRWGLNPNDLKLITAVFVFAALVAPSLLRKWRSSTRNPKVAAENHA